VSALRALAAAAGIVAAYRDTHGRWRRTGDDTRRALLAAMGLEAGSERAARVTLTEWRRAAGRGLPTVSVTTTRGGRPGAGAGVGVGVGAARARPRLTLRLDGEARRRGTVPFRLEVVEESGETWTGAGRLAARRGRAALRLPQSLPLGYHTLRLHLAGAGGAPLEQLVIVAPDRCPSPAARGARRAFGLTVQLYAVRSARNGGAGDFTDLAALVRWARELGAAFVAVNPLHALDPTGERVSPYSPISRLFLHSLYLDAEAVPELAECPAARDLVTSEVYRRARAELRQGDRVAAARVLALQWPVLRALSRCFADRGATGARGRAYAAFVARHGDPLTDFATFLALAAHRGSPAWTDWPSELRDAQGPAVAAYRAAHADDVDLHRFVQFELDRQLGVAARAGGTGVALGLMADLAVGTVSDGADTWARPALFAERAGLGAPPDDYAREGQAWRLVPLHPHRLAADPPAVRHWIRLVRGALAHAGALRVDHVMSLFRQYWIPPGASARDGAYVRYPAEVLLAVLAVEADRRGAVIVGEDLGTVPRGLPARLHQRGILSTRVLYFERDRGGAFRPAARYSRRALVTATTHDHPPLAGYWQGRDLELRRAAGNIPDERALATAQRRRVAERAALRRRLVAEGGLAPTTVDPSPPELAGAVHTFLARTPAPLVGIALDDLTGEAEPVNLPGIGSDRYRGWTRRLGVPLEALPRDARARRALGRLDSRRTGSPT
jgi:4-alpha-glucanotransferase